MSIQSKYLLVVLALVPGLLFVFFRLGAGMIQGREQALRLPKIAYGPDASIDWYLAAEGVELKTDELRRVLNALPDDEGVLLIPYPGEQNFGFRFYLFSHLGWPRKIGKLECEKLPAPAALFYPGERRDRIRWIVYFKDAPPPAVASSARELDHNLWLAPVKEGITWNLYCSD